MGARSYKSIIKYLDQLEGAIVEIGSERGEGSTSFFAGAMINRPQFDFYTVDIDQHQFEYANSYTKLLPNVHAYHMKGEDFLRDIFPEFNKQICYAYLDNFDWCWDHEELKPHIQEQLPNYEKFGLKVTNENSQLAHLEQTKSLIPHVADRCLIQFDDTWIHNWKFDGKGGLAVPWLVEQGWNPVVDSTQNDSILVTNFTL